MKILDKQNRTEQGKGVKVCVLGEAGVGKTSLLKTLPVKETLFVDLEAGDLSVHDWEGDSIRFRSWRELRHFTCYVGGPNESLPKDQPYSVSHYEIAKKMFDGEVDLSKYKHLFIDSITVAGRMCFNWVKASGEANSEKTGKFDTRAAYGMHGKEMINMITHLQHAREKHIWFVGILEKKVDDYGAVNFQLQMEGSKCRLELSGIVDQVVTMATINKGDKKNALVCNRNNRFDYPAKDRSGRLNEIEEADLGKLADKILTDVNKEHEATNLEGNENESN